MNSDDTPMAGLQAIFQGARSFGLSEEDAWRTVDGLLLAVGTEATVAEYLDEHHPGPVRMLPPDADGKLQSRLWDRFFDQYVSVPMQKIVTDRIRPAGAADPHGVADARATLRTAYEMLDTHLSDKDWAIGAEFGLADCSAAPALFYSAIVEPFPADKSHLAGYFNRLMARPSVQRVLAEARPYFAMFPYREAIPPRFLAD
jgi:glutathione S-transferase